MVLVATSNAHTRVFFFNKKRVTAVHSHAGTKHTTRVAVTQRNSPSSFPSLSFPSLPFSFPSLPFPSLSLSPFPKPAPPSPEYNPVSYWEWGPVALFKCKVWRRVWEAERAKAVLTDGTIVGAVQRAAKSRCPK
jgi:hypothetical protein